MTELFDRATRLGSAAEQRWQDLDRDCRVPADLHTAALDSGLFRALVPVELGGLGASALDWFRCGVEMARHEASLAWVVTQGAVELGYIAVGGDPTWASQVLADPRAVSASSIGGMGRLRREAEGLLFDGRWSFNTGAHVATWIGGLATFEGSSPSDVRLAWVPAENARIIDDWDPSGLRGSGSNSTIVPEQRVDEAWVLRPFSAVDRSKGPHSCLLGNGNWPIACSVAAVELGAARRAIDEAVLFVQGRATDTPRGSLARDPVVQRDIIHAQSVWNACVASVERELESMWAEAAQSGVLSVPQRVRLLAANALAVSESLRIIEIVCGLTGTLSVRRDHPLSRARRDAQALRGHRAVNGAALELAGKVWLGVILEHRRV